MGRAGLVYPENTWMATPDNGLVAQLYSEGKVRARVGDGQWVSVEERTHYPFEEQVEMTVKTGSAATWPMYFESTGLVQRTSGFCEWCCDAFFG